MQEPGNCQNKCRLDKGQLCHTQRSQLRKNLGTTTATREYMLQDVWTWMQQLLTKNVNGKSACGAPVVAIKKTVQSGCWPPC